MFESLNSYSPLISAVAALVSAGALVAVALLNRATWKLYKLEKKRVEADQEELMLGLQLLSLTASQAQSELEEFLSLPEEDQSQDKYEQALYCCSYLEETFSTELPHLLDRARSVSTETVTKLTLARSCLRDVQADLPKPSSAYDPDRAPQLRKLEGSVSRLSEVVDGIAPEISSDDVFGDLSKMRSDFWDQALSRFTDRALKDGAWRVHRRRSQGVDKSPQQPRAETTQSSASDAGGEGESNSSDDSSYTSLS